MAADTTTLDLILKNLYLDGLPKWFNRNRPLYNEIVTGAKKEDFKGRKFIFAASDVNTQGVGWRAEGATLPVGGNVGVVNLELTSKQLYATARVTAQLMNRADTDKAAFANGVETELGSARDQMEEELHIQTVGGTGAGDLAEVSSVSGSTITTKVQPTTVGGFGTRRVRKNMVIDSYTARTGGTQNANSQNVTAVTNSANTFTVSGGTGTIAANDFIFREDSRGEAVVGMRAAVDDGTYAATYQTVSRTAQPLLKANFLGNSGTLRAWTPELMDQLGTEAWLNGAGGYPDTFWSNLEIQRRAAAFIRADKRVEMQEVTLDYGYKTVVWTTPNGQRPWIVDQYVWPNEVWAVKKEDIFWAMEEEMDFERGDGGMWRFVDRTHTFEAWLYTWRNLGCRKCNDHSALRDVSHTL